MTPDDMMKRVKNHDRGVELHELDKVCDRLEGEIKDQLIPMSDWRTQKAGWLFDQLFLVGYAKGMRHEELGFKVDDEWADILAGLYNTFVKADHGLRAHNVSQRLKNGKGEGDVDT